MVKCHPWTPTPGGHSLETLHCIPGMRCSSCGAVAVGTLRYEDVGGLTQWSCMLGVSIPNLPAAHTQLALRPLACAVRGMHPCTFWGGGDAEPTCYLDAPLCTHVCMQLTARTNFTHTIRTSRDPSHQLITHGIYRCGTCMYTAVVHIHALGVTACLCRTVCLGMCTACYCCYYMGHLRPYE